MQSARIWFRQPHPSIALTNVDTFLNELGATTEETEWSLGTFVVPQIYVIQPVPFLIQLNTDDYVVEEAKEFSELGSVPDNLSEKLSSCDARLEIGDVSENSVIYGREITAFAGWTGIDPGHPELQKLLRALASKLDGIFEDNVNGTFWSDK